MGWYKVRRLEAGTCLSAIPFLPSDFLCGSFTDPAAVQILVANTDRSASGDMPVERTKCSRRNSADG